LAEGKIGEFATNTVLTSRDCFLIAELAEKEGKYAYAVEWLDTAYNLFHATSGLDANPHFKSRVQSKLQMLILKVQLEQG